MSGALPAYDITPEQADQLAAIERKVVPGRSCGTCSLCCKVVSIPLFGKPAGTWCSHSRPGKGCGIHASRPFVCRGAFCEWMISKGLGPEWKPDVAKFALFVREDGHHLTAHVDPGFAGAWQREPYYRQFKIWAAQGLQRRPRIQVIDIMIGEQVTVVLPDRDVPVGIVAEDEALEYQHSLDLPGHVVAVRVIKRAAAQVTAA
jgi:hypothetical protein